MFHVGEIHRVENLISTLVLPSLNRFHFISFHFVSFHVGEIHRVDVIFYSRSPLSEPFFVADCFFRCRGDHKERRNFNTLVLPSIILMRSVLCILAFWHFWAFWCFVNLGPQVILCYIIGVADSLYICIYSLGHFLTTKGALIDGDGYPPKNPKKGSKKWQKMTTFHSNLMSKKC